jgi:hypothetical protein
VPVPLPLPTVSHDVALLDAVHEHTLFDGVTVTLPLPDPAPGLAVAEEIVYVQPFACVTVCVCPAIVSVPVLSGPGFASTV